MMKKGFYVLALILAATIALQSCRSTSPAEAAQYNDKLMEQQRNVVMKYDKLLESFDTYVGSKMDNAYSELQDQITFSKFEINRDDSPSGTEDLKDALIEYLGVYENFMDRAIPRLIEIYKLPENEFTKDLHIEWDNTYKDMDSNLKEADKKLKSVQKDYAEKFKLKLAQ